MQVKMILHVLRNIQEVIVYLADFGVVTINRMPDSRDWELTVDSGLFDHKGFSAATLACNVGIIIGDINTRIVSLPAFIIHSNESTEIVAQGQDKEIFGLDDDDDDNLIDLNAMDISRYDGLDEIPDDDDSELVDIPEVFEE